MLHLGAARKLVLWPLRSPSICPAVGIIVIHTCFRFVSGAPAVQCARSGRSSGGPSPSSPRISAVHAQQRVSRPSPRRTSCRAVCAMNCVWRLSTVYSPQNWWRGVLHLTTSELIASSIHEFDSRSGCSFCGTSLSATTQCHGSNNHRAAPQPTTCVCTQPAHSRQRAYVCRLPASRQQTGGAAAAGQPGHAYAHPCANSQAALS
jgi:hypothetical protein